MIHRRAFLGAISAGAALMAFGGASVAKAAQNPKDPADLNLVNLHTGERFKGQFRDRQDYLPDALGELQTVLRDFRTGDEHEIDPRLFDWMASLKQRLGGGEFGIISGYRSPKTNDMLRANSNGVAKKSWHMQGRAIDLRLSNVDTAALRKLAMADQKGGVGYYAKSDFVHIDTGRPRFW